VVERWVVGGPDRPAGSPAPGQPALQPVDLVAGDRRGDGGQPAVAEHERVADVRLLVLRLEQGDGEGLQHRERREGEDRARDADAHGEAPGGGPRPCRTHAPSSPSRRIAWWADRTHSGQSSPPEGSVATRRRGVNLVWMVRLG